MVLCRGGRRECFLRSFIAGIFITTVCVGGGGGDERPNSNNLCLKDQRHIFMKIWNMHSTPKNEKQHNKYTLCVYIHIITYLCIKKI